MRKRKGLLFITMIANVEVHMGAFRGLHALIRECIHTVFKCHGVQPLLKGGRPRTKASHMR